MERRKGSAADGLPISRREADDRRRTVSLMLRKGIRRTTAALMAVLMLLGGTGRGMDLRARGETAEKEAIAEAKDKISDNQQKISALEAEQQRISNTLEQLNGLKGQAVQYIQELDRQLETISSEIVSVGDQITAKEAEIGVAQQQLETAQAEEQTQYDSMKLRIRYMYEKGNTSFIDMILNCRSWSELLNKAEYIGSISRYDRDRLEDYRAARQAVKDAETVLEQEHGALLSLKEETEAKQAGVQQLLNEKNAEISSYNDKIAAAQAEASQAASAINELEEATKAEEANIAAMEAELKRQEEAARKKAEEAGKTYSARTLQGGMIWPCPASSTISSYFGSREAPTEGASTSHKGIDISAPTGSSVVAAAAGQVVIATYSASAGNYVMVNHGSGIYTVYMHLSGISVSQGQEVSQGQKLGTVGSTGYSTGPHLHFGIRQNGSYVDPLSYVG